MGSIKAPSQKQSMFSSSSQNERVQYCHGDLSCVQYKNRAARSKLGRPPLGNSSDRSDFETHVPFSTSLCFSHETRRERLQKMASVAMAHSSFRPHVRTLSSIFQYLYGK